MPELTPNELACAVWARISPEVPFDSLNSLIRTDYETQARGVLAGAQGSAPFEIACRNYLDNPPAPEPEIPVRDTAPLKPIEQPAEVAPTTEAITSETETPTKPAKLASKLAARLSPKKK